MGEEVPDELDLLKWRRSYMDNLRNSVAAGKSWMFDG